MGADVNRSELVGCLILSLGLGGLVVLLEGLRGAQSQLFASTLLLLGLAFAVQRWGELRRGIYEPCMTILDGVSDLVIGGVITLIGVGIMLT